MRPEIHVLTEEFKVRKSRKQKTAFLAWMQEILTKAGYETKIEEKGLLRSRNLVVGDPASAKVIYTAHYDTPAVLPFPNFITPQNYLVYGFYQVMLALVILGLLAIFEAAGFFLIKCIFGEVSPLLTLIWLYVGLFGLLYLMMAGKANKNNYNDNTSGTATLLQCALTLPDEFKDQVCFIWFDHEELGLVGSSQFYSQHKKEVLNTLLLNFDCVSDGHEILFVPGKKAKQGSTQEHIVSAFPSDGVISAQWAGKHTFYPSDQTWFPKGVGVASFKRGKRIGLYLDRIHTGKDTVFQEENILFLSRGMVNLLRSLSQ